MSVLMTISLKGDPKRLEEFAGGHVDQMRAVADQAKAHGVIAHRFYGTDGEIMVVDEWPDAESFHKFFEETGEEIREMFGGTGAEPTGAPQLWRKLDTHDEVGWGA